MFKSFKDWRIAYEEAKAANAALRAYGISRGWIATRDPVKEPTPAGNEPRSRAAQKIAEHHEQEEKTQRKLMGYE